jgi:hypothetical protein
MLVVHNLLANVNRRPIVIKGLFYRYYGSVNPGTVASWGSQQDLLGSGILDVSHPSMINGTLADCGGKELET